MSWTIQTDNISYEREEVKEAFQDVKHLNSWTTEEESPPPIVDTYMQIKKLNKVPRFLNGFDLKDELQVEEN